MACQKINGDKQESLTMVAATIWGDTLMASPPCAEPVATTILHVETLLFISTVNSWWFTTALLVTYLCLTSIH